MHYMLRELQFLHLILQGLAAPTFEHPLKEVNQNEIVKNFGDFTPDRITIEDLGEKNSLAIKLMRDAAWD